MSGKMRVMKKTDKNLKSLILKKVKNCILIDRIYDQNLLGTFYSMGDVFVICSSWENFPTTCIEAQCCGTLVSGFDKCGTKETIIVKNGMKDRNNKRESIADQAIEPFVAYGDVEALAKAVEKTLSQKNDKEGLSRAAKEKYSRKRMGDAYLNLYREIV